MRLRQQPLHLSSIPLSPSGQLSHTLPTSFSRDVLRERIQVFTRKPKTDLHPPDPDFPYEGRVDDDGFVLRISVPGKTLMPKLRGTFQEGEEGITVVVTTNLKEVVTSAIGVMVGIMLPFVAIMGTVIVIGTLKLVAVIITVGICGIMMGYILSIRKTLENEFRNDARRLTGLILGKEGERPATL